MSDVYFVHTLMYPSNIVTVTGPLGKSFRFYGNPADGNVAYVPRIKTLYCYGRYIEHILCSNGLDINSEKVEYLKELIFFKTGILIADIQ